MQCLQVRQHLINQGLHFKRPCCVLEVLRLVRAVRYAGDLQLIVPSTALSHGSSKFNSSRSQLRSAA